MQKEVNRAVISIADDIFSGLRQDEVYNEMYHDDPHIREASDYAVELQKNLKETFSTDRQHDLLDALVGAYSVYAAAAENVATLYGMRVAHAMRYMIDSPIELSQYIYERCHRVRDIYPVEEVGHEDH